MPRRLYENAQPTTAFTPPSIASAVAQPATSTSCSVTSSASLAIFTPSSATPLRSTSEGEPGQVDAPGPSTRSPIRPAPLPARWTPAPLGSPTFKVEPAPSPIMVKASSTMVAPSTYGVALAGT